MQAQSPVRKRREVVEEGNVRSTNNYHVVNVERYIQTNLAGHVVLRVRVYLNTCTNDSGNGFTMPTLKLSVSLSPQVTVTHLNNIPNDGITNPTRSMRSMGRLIGDCQQQWGNLSIIANTTSAHIQQTILPCCRRSLRVSFAALGWGDWVRCIFSTTPTNISKCSGDLPCRIRLVLLHWSMYDIWRVLQQRQWWCPVCRCTESAQFCTRTSTESLLFTRALCTIACHG